MLRLISIIGVATVLVSWGCSQGNRSGSTASSGEAQGSTSEAGGTSSATGGTSGGATEGNGNAANTGTGGETQPAPDNSSLDVESITVNPSSIGANGQAEIVVRVVNHGSGRSRPCGIEARGGFSTANGAANVPVDQGRVPELDPGQTYEAHLAFRPSMAVQRPAGQWDLAAYLKAWVSGQTVSTRVVHATAYVGG